ncbi:hypothetical protein, partial [Clostridium perfringens]
TNAPDATSLATAGDATYAADPGYIADRTAWMRAAGAGGSVRSGLANRRPLAALPGNVEKWYETLLTVAREAEHDGQYQVAY